VSDMSKSRLIATVTACSAVAAVALGLITPWGNPAWWMVPATALAVAITYLFPARIVIGRQVLTFALSDAFFAVGLAVRPGTWLAIALAGGFVLARARRLTAEKLAFNVATFALSGVIGVACTFALGGGILAAAVGVLATFLSNYLLIALAISTASGRSLLHVLRESVFLNLIHEGGNASVGLLGGWLAIHAPVGLLGLVVPIGLLWWSYAQQAQRAAEARLFEELARGQEQVLGTSVDTSAQVVVTAAARSFGGAEVELLVQHPDGPMRYLGDENGLTSRARAESDAFGAPWVLRALSAHRASSGTEDNRPYCTAVLGRPDRAMAVLVARRPSRAAPFTRADEQLAEVLVTQAESWLSMADLTAQADVARGEAEVYRAATRVLGDIGIETGPALVVLRESSDRLARLASRFDGPDPVSQIVDELHSVERAVASLLGAIALAQPAPTTARAESEWTTTGRLEPADRG
jgi:hypothetical protein